MKLKDFTDGVVIMGKTMLQMRLNLFLTQKQLALILGVTPKTISAWENQRSGGLPRYIGLAMNYVYKFCPRSEKTHKYRPPEIVQNKKSPSPKGAPSDENPKLATPLAVVPGKPEGTEEPA